MFLTELEILNCKGKTIKYSNISLLFDLLGALLCIGEGVQTVWEFNSHDARKSQCNDKVCCLRVLQHESCSRKQQKVNVNLYIDIDEKVFHHL